MTSVNWSRVIIGGLVAGVIVDISEGLLNGVFLAQDWADAMKAIGKPAIDGSAIAVFNLMGLAMGVFMIWLYAGLRTRFGPGPGTAIRAGLATWVVGYLLASIPAMVTQVFPQRLTMFGLAVGLVEVLVASVAGAYFYKEESAGSGQAKTAAV